MGLNLTLKPFTMRSSTLTSAAFVISIISAGISAHSQDLSIVLRADSTSKSVLVSNLLENRAGDQSPIMGTATWLDNGKQIQCRSLLAFDYGILPKIIKPEQITGAQLILNPMQLNTPNDGNENQSSKFIVRRVLQHWEDSLTSWINQPQANITDEVEKSVPGKKKDRSVKIDVTKMVKEMFLTGNNGFMIRYEDSMDKTSSFSQWFASAKNENENMRPVLIISFAAPHYVSQYTDQKYLPLPITAKDRDELMQMYFRPEPVITAPVTTVSTEPIKNEPVKN